MTIEYAAAFAPLVYVTGTPDAIRQLATEPAVFRITTSTTTSLSMASAGPTDQADWSYNSGYRGAGSRIAVVEYNNVNWSATDLSTIPSGRRVSYSTGSVAPGNHPTLVMGTIASQTSGRRGTAPDAFFISSATGGAQGASEAQDFRILQAIDTAVDPALGNADVVNLSIVQDTAAGASALTAYVDEVARSAGVHFTTAGGNHVPNCDATPGIEVLDQIRPPGDAWNSITTGGIDDKNTASWADDTVWTHCYKDPPGGTFKPEMSAPAVSVTVAGLSDSGVSFANPQVAGAFGQLIGQKPTELRDEPVKTKAILRAASMAHRTAYPGQVDAPLDDREGLGSLTTKWANLVADRRLSSGYPLGDFGSWIANGLWNGSCYTTPSATTLSVSTAGGRKIRFVISWQSHGFYLEGSNGFGTDDSYSDTRQSDIDLYVYDKNGTLVDASASFNWNTEWVEWTYDGTRGPYSVQIRPYSWSCYLAQEKIGWAWVAWSTP